MLSLSVSFQLYRMNYEGPALGDLIGQFEPSLTLTSAMIPGSIKRPYIQVVFAASGLVFVVSGSEMLPSP